MSAELGDLALDRQGAVTTSPDHRPTRGPKRLLKLVKDTFKQGGKPIADYVMVPAPAPTRFANEPLADLVGKLATKDLGVAKALLAEAEATYAEAEARIESAERRATTLQGTVAVAASVSLAGGGLLLDPSRVNGQGWRIALGALLLCFVGCLAGCAIRALGATSRIFRFGDPGVERIVDRVAKNECDVLTYRAAELLRAFGVADVIGATKVGLLRSAAWWFRLAILFLAVLTAVILVYTIAGPQPPAPVVT